MKRTIVGPFSLPEVLAAGAALAAAIASIAGFVPGLYRDRAVVIEQTHGYDAGNLVVVAALLVGLGWSIRSSVRGRLVVIGALGCLVYSYVTYAFLIVLNPVTLLYIAVLGLAGWSVITGLLRFDEGEIEPIERGRFVSRATGIFMILLAVVFASNWLRQIGAGVAGGHLPADLAANGWPMNPVWVLDLGFVLPLFAIGGVGMLRRRPYAIPVAMAVLVFMALLSITVLCMAVAMAVAGQTLDVALLAIFGIVLVVSTVLAAAWFRPPRPAERRQAIGRLGTSAPA
ncbi:MAG TPA: hypothetical protein VFR33_13735 [Candidatus Dormibacteraeota bacterium]|nr:hypothetical protein [Candidatus Dormibacteraeota bacterium]